MTTLGEQLLPLLQDTNIRAFLSMIKSSEGATYNSLFGDIPSDDEHRKTFTSYDKHPSLQYPQLPKPYGYTSYTNKAGETINTSAAGSYQIIKPTWIALQERLGLPDFSPQSQDLGALELIREKGAIPVIQQGLFADAVHACSGIWASLIGSTANQPTHDLAILQGWYVSAGGNVA